MQIGQVEIQGNVIAAPMAGVADAPYRALCCSLGASYAVGEMVSANPDLARTAKSLLRLDMSFGSGLRSVQLVGADPLWMAQAARRAAECGAQIIDINMGCPVRKVCQADCGAFLMRDEALAGAIVASVVRAVPVPVTVKMRTGWDSAHRNAATLARIAEDAGAAMVTVHGRTRQQLYSGSAEYETIAQVKSAVHIPVIANGDIDSADKARRVLLQTGADGVMIGRSALGKPWLFGQVRDTLAGRPAADEPLERLVCATLRRHWQLHYAFHGQERGVRLFRRHARAYLEQLPRSQDVIARVMLEETAGGQRRLLEDFMQTVHSERG